MGVACKKCYVHSQILTSLLSYWISKKGLRLLNLLIIIRLGLGMQGIRLSWIFCKNWVMGPLASVETSVVIGRTVQTFLQKNTKKREHKLIRMPCIPNTGDSCNHYAPDRSCTYSHEQSICVCKNLIITSKSHRKYNPTH